jgi:DNA-binding response OmpR family regulator
MTAKKRILLVDDHRTVLRLLEAILKLKGYELLYAENGQQGMAMARQEQPDLILLDVMMPEIDGFKVCQYLKGQAQTAHIPVVFLTARGAADDRAAGRRAGAQGFLTKPFLAREVLELIERLLARSEPAQYRIAKPAHSAGPSSHSTATSSTLARGGPCRHQAVARSTTSRSPSNNASTLPSGRLRTQPRKPSPCAISTVDWR